MGTTALTPLPYPESTDQPFVHLDLRALADAVAESLFVNSATQPPAKAGRRWYDPVAGRNRWSDGTVFREGAPGRGRFEMGAAQSIVSAAALTTLTQMTATDSAFYDSADTTCFTIAAGVVTVKRPGLYLARANVVFAANGTGGPTTRKIVCLAKNGTDATGEVIGSNAVPSIQANDQVVSVVSPVVFAANDTVRILAFQDSGAAQNVVAGVTTNYLSKTRLELIALGV